VTTALDDPVTHLFAFVAPFSSRVCDVCSFCVGGAEQNSTSYVKDAVRVRCSCLTLSLAVIREETG
jgi:hypothetical protein